MSKVTDLYTHPDGQELVYDHKSGELELHAEHDRQWLTVPIGAAGLHELSSKLATLAVVLAQEQEVTLFKHSSGALLQYSSGRGDLEVLAPDGSESLGLAMDAGDLIALGRACVELGTQIQGGVQ